MSVDKKFLIERQGKQVVLYQGLLDLAHEMGLVSLRSEILQFPNMDNGGTCYAMATAIFKRNGEEMIFQDFADANAGNVTPAMKNCIPRMAATRAKARCLRDGTNCGVTAFEELGDDHQEEQNQQFRRGQSPSPQRDEYTGQRPPNVDANGEIHDGVPSRPPLSRVQQKKWESSGEMRMAIEAAAREEQQAQKVYTEEEQKAARREFRQLIGMFDEAYADPVRFNSERMTKWVAAICEDDSPTEAIYVWPPSWKYATAVLRSFKGRHPVAPPVEIVQAMQRQFQCPTTHGLPEFSGVMWNTLDFVSELEVPPAGGKPNDSVINAATMYSAPETVKAR